MTTGITLALEGATYAGSVAVFREISVIASAMIQSTDTPGRGGRDEAFLPMVDRTLREAGLSPSDIDRVVCGAGPGSFTSLRVAASVAKGIAVGVGCPLFAASSLLLMVAGRKDGRFLATLPAMRGEVYAAVIEAESYRLRHVAPAMIIAEGAIGEHALGAGAEHVSGIPDAKALAAILDDVVEAGPCDIDTWEPSYGRLAEAQVKWEAAHGRPLPVSG